MPETGTRQRIFIAVELEPSLRRAIADLEERLARAGARLRWIPLENLHLTLRFLGEITPAQLAQVRLATREAAAGAAPFHLTLQGVGAFPTLQRPQVVWVGVGEGEGAESLAALSSRLDETLAREGFPREDRAFVAHLTLARVRDRRLWGDLHQAISGARGTEVGGQEVRAVSVMESHLHPRGARYTLVEEVPLGEALKSTR